MSKWTKRVLSALLVCAMMLGCSGFSFAEAADAAGIRMTPIEVFSESGLIETVELPETALDQEPPEISVGQGSSGVSSAAVDTHFEMVKIVDNGSDADKIVLTIVGDGFTAEEQDAFVTSATDVADYLLNKHPYSAFRDVFNVYAIKVISQESGAVETQTGSINNYFGSRFYSDGVTERLVYVTKTTKLRNLLKHYSPECDAPVVLVNSTKYGGAGGEFAVLSCHPSASEVLVHELGHSVGGLADEYWFRGREAPNMTANNNPQTVKWNSWVGVNNVGVYAFEENHNWYRPHNNCAMRYLNRSFCEVCSAELTRVLAEKSTGGFYGKSTLIHAKIAGGTKKIGNYAYYGSGALRTVAIPDSVTDIGRYAFLRCTGLSTIVNLAAVPQDITGNDVFYGIDRSRVTLCVPPGAKASYEAAGWTGFKEILETLDTDTAAKIAQIEAVTDGLNEASYTAASWQALQAAISDAVAAAGTAATPEALGAVAIPDAGGLVRAKGIFGTNSRWYGAWWHYVLFFLGFGFIWMWF